jgi:hypothetical protein
MPGSVCAVRRPPRRGPAPPRTVAAFAGRAAAAQPERLHLRPQRCRRCSRDDHAMILIESRATDAWAKHHRTCRRSRAGVMGDHSLPDLRQHQRDSRARWPCSPGVHASGEPSRRDCSSKASLPGPQYGQTTVCHRGYWAFIRARWPAPPRVDGRRVAAWPAPHAGGSVVGLRPTTPQASVRKADR